MQYSEGVYLHKDTSKHFIDIPLHILIIQGKLSIFNA